MIFDRPDYNLADDILLVDAGEKFFTIPSYQRDFVWNEKETEDFVLAIDTTNLNSDCPVGKHIGHIILDPNKSNNEIQITDGQQRIVEVSFILHNLLKREGISKSNERWINKVLFAEDDNGKTLARVKPKNDDWCNYNDIMFDRYDSKDKSQMFKCYKRIRDVLKDIAPNADALNKFVEKMRMVTVTCKTIKANEDARIIYADINSKSHIMKDFDLMRCYVLEKNNSHANEKFKRLEEILDGNDTKKLKYREDFFRDFVKMKAEAAVKKSDFGIYRAFTELYPSNSGFDPIQIIHEMIKYAKAYRELVMENHTDVCNGIIPYIYKPALNIESVMPLLLRLHVGVDDKEISQSTVAEISNTLTAVLVRGKLCGEASRGQSFEDTICKAYSVCRDRGDSDFAKNFANYLKGREGSASDEDVIQSIVSNQDFYSKGSQRAFVNLILCGAELALSMDEKINAGNLDKLSEYLSLADNREIDHILAQNMPVDLLKNHEFTKDEYELWKYRIGNLGILDKKDNQNKSDRDAGIFYNRRDPIFNEINTKLVSDIDKWTKEDIYKRSEILAHAIVKAWPDPCEK